MRPPCLQLLLRMFSWVVLLLVTILSVSSATYKERKFVQCGQNEWTCDTENNEVIFDCTTQNSYDVNILHIWSTAFPSNTTNFTVRNCLAVQMKLQQNTIRENQKNDTNVKIENIFLLKIDKELNTKPIIFKKDRAIEKNSKPINLPRVLSIRNITSLNVTFNNLLHMYEEPLQLIIEDTQLNEKHFKNCFTAPQTSIVFKNVGNLKDWCASSLLSLQITRVNITFPLRLIADEEIILNGNNIESDIKLVAHKRVRAEGNSIQNSQWNAVSDVIAFNNNVVQNMKWTSISDQLIFKNNKIDDIQDSNIQARESEILQNNVTFMKNNSFECHDLYFTGNTIKTITKDGIFAKIQNVFIKDNKIKLLSMRSINLRFQNLTVTNNIIHEVLDYSFKLEPYKYEDVYSSLIFNDNTFKILSKKSLILNQETNQLFNQLIIKDNSFECNCFNMEWFDWLRIKENRIQLLFNKQLLNPYNNNTCFNIPYENCTLQYLSRHPYLTCVNVDEINCYSLENKMIVSQNDTSFTFIVLCVLTFLMIVINTLIQIWRCMK